jgi:O-antigen/teichoic acid export membrane protein
LNKTPKRTAAKAAYGAAATTGETVLHAGVWAIGSRLLPQFYSLLVSVVAARSLGPDGMGRQSLIAFAAIFGTTAATLGVPTAVMRFVGETVGVGRPETLQPLVRAAWRIETVAAAVGAGVLIAIGVAGAEPRAAWILTGFVCGMSILQKVATSVLVGLQRWREASAVSLLTGTLGAIATVIVLSFGGGVTGMIAVGAAASLATLIWTAIRARRRMSALASTSRRDPDLHRRTWRYAVIASIGVPVTLIVWFRSEFFFLEHYSSNKQIALYSIAFSAYTAVVILPQTAATVLAPAFSTLYGAGSRDRIRSGFGRATRLLLTATLPLTAAAATLVPPALKLVYGHQYSGTASTFLIMLVVLPLVPLLQISTSLLVGLQRQWFATAIGALAAVIDVSAAALLIPRHAAIGAAIANALAQVAMAVPLLLYAMYIIGGIEWAAPMLMRAAIASVASAACGTTVLRQIPGATGLAIGAITVTLSFILLARLLRVVSQPDAAWFERTVPRSLKPLVRWTCRP